MSLRRAGAAIGLAAALSALLAVGVGGLVGTYAQESDPAPPSDLAVEWDYEPAGLPDLVSNSPAIVVARVEAVRDGEPMYIGPVDADTGIAPSVPTERVDLHVTETIDGQAPEDFTLFVLGGPGERPEGMPRFDVGESDLLFVRQRLNDPGTAPHPDGTWIAVAPEGRLERLPSGELASPTDGPVAEALDGATVPEASAAIDDAGASDQDTSLAPWVAAGSHAPSSSWSRR